jgi:plasmid maintenance system killer protein
MTTKNFLDIYKRRFERELQIIEPSKRIQWLRLKKKACLELIKDYQAELNIFGKL